MMNNSPDYEKAQNIAYEILKINKAKIFPIEPLNIINSLNNCYAMTYKDFALINDVQLNEVSTLLNSDDAATWENENNQKIIFYNQDVNSKYRIRFTLAHELGHIVLGHITENKVGITVSDDKYDAYEKEANYFAKRLLAPLPIIYRLVSELNDHRITSFEISNIFQISDQSAYYVVDNMNRIPFAVADEELCHHYQEGMDNALKLIEPTHENSYNF